MEYRKIRIKDIGKVVTGKTPKTSNEEYYGGNIMFISPVELHDGYCIKNSEKSITQVGLKSIKNNTIRGTSVLVGCIGWDMGNVAMCHEECATNQQINSITDFKDDFNPYYIYYWLKTKKEYLFSIASVTRTPILSKATFEDIEIPVPSRKYQDHVVGVLKTIDEKIENNKKISDSLQNQIDVLYDYWFIQYQFPNSEGYPYKASGGNFYLDKDNRNIPCSWKCIPLSEIEGNIVTGKTPSTEDTSNYGHDVPFITIGDIRNNKYIISTESYLSKKGADTQQNKYLPAGSLCVTCIASPGIIGFTTEESQTNQQINSIVFSRDDNREFLFCALQRYFNKNNVVKTGSTFANMNKEDFSNIPIIYPDTTTLSKFHMLTIPLVKRMERLSQETNSLIALREWLLPILLNGQATISD